MKNRDKVFIINPDEGTLIETTPDTPNEIILERRQAALDKITRPKNGDFIIMTDGTLKRFCHDWGEEGLQTTTGGSFYLGENGSVSYSGGLDPTTPLYRIEPTGQRRAGSVWFFDRDIWGAGRGVYLNAIFNVWKETAREDMTTAQHKQRARLAARRIREAVEKYGDEIDWIYRLQNTD